MRLLTFLLAYTLIQFVKPGKQPLVYHCLFVYLFVCLQIVQNHLFSRTAPHQGVYQREGGTSSPVTTPTLPPDIQSVSVWMAIGLGYNQPANSEQVRQIMSLFVSMNLIGCC